MIKDYGTKLKNNGFSRKLDINFYGVSFVGCFKLDSSLYTFATSTHDHEEELVLYFDFSNHEFRTISKIVNSEGKVFYKSSIFDNRLMINEPIYLDIKARLGEVQENLAGDKFIPLVIKQINLSKI